MRIGRCFAAPCLLLVAVACGQTNELRGRSEGWPDRVAYEHRGDLHSVGTDGTNPRLLRPRTRRASPEQEPDVALYDLWESPVKRPGAQEIAAIRARNASLSAFPSDPAVYDQSWELVLVDPADSSKDRVLYRTRRPLGDLRWSDDGNQILGRVGRRDVLIWRNGRAEVHALRIRDEVSPDRSLECAAFTRDGEGVVVLMDNHLEQPHLVGTADLDGATLHVDPRFTFAGRHIPEDWRASESVVRLLGHGTAGSALDLPFFVAPGGRRSFYYRKREGLFARGWIEGVDGLSGEVFEIHTIWRDVYAK